MILLFGQFVNCSKVLRLNPYKRRLRDIWWRFTVYVLEIFCTLQYVFWYPYVLFMFVLLLYRAKLIEKKLLGILF